jgi:hypothetical protein
MYNNVEINKRSHAVNVDVRSWSNFLNGPLSHYLQDIRDLVLHVIADAPPPNWLQVDVGLLTSQA